MSELWLPASVAAAAVTLTYVFWSVRVLARKRALPGGGRRRLASESGSHPSIREHEMLGQQRPARPPHNSFTSRVHHVGGLMLWGPHALNAGLPTTRRTGFVCKQ